MGIRFFSRLLDSCCSTRNLQKLKKLHAQMIVSDISHDEFIRTKLVISYSACAQLHEASIIFSYSNRQSTFLHNLLICGLCSANRFHDSILFFRNTMLRASKPFDRHTLPRVLKSCAGIPALDIGRSIHALVFSNGFDSDVNNSNSLVTMYSKCSDLESAQKVFDEMPVRNVITGSAMMSAYGLYGRYEKVSTLFDTMIRDGVVPDELAFTAVLSACNRGGLAEKAVEYFQMMNMFKVRPSLEHCTCMVDVLGKAGRVEDAIAIVEEMDGYPDEVLWRTLLGVCKTYGRLEIVEKLTERIASKRLGERENLLINH